MAFYLTAKDDPKNWENLTCPVCHFVGKGKTESAMNTLTFIILLLLGIIPGIIYAVWCGTQRPKHKCPRCGSRNAYESEPMEGKVPLNEKKEKILQEKPLSQKKVQTPRSILVWIILFWLFFGSVLAVFIPWLAILLWVLTIWLFPTLKSFKKGKARLKLWKAHKWRVALTIVGLLFLSPFLVIDTSTSPVQKEFSAPVSGESSDVAPKKTKNTIQVKKTIEIEVPVYEVVEDKDISFESFNEHVGARRSSLRVLIEQNPISKAEIEVVSKKLLETKAGEKPDAVSILYYFDRSQTEGAYTLAMAEWAPNGDWSKASLGRDQKLTHKFTKHVGAERKDEPTPEERRISKMMKDLFYEKEGALLDAELAVILAPEVGMSAQEIQDIHWKVSLFDMGR